MYYDFEYQTIIDRCSEKFNMKVSEVSRTALIFVYETQISKLETQVDFELVCERVLTEAYLEGKYPALGVFQKIFLPHNLN